MRDHHLLLGSGIRVKGKQNFIRFRVVSPVPSKTGNILLAILFFHLFFIKIKIHILQR